MKITVAGCCLGRRLRATGNQGDSDRPSPAPNPGSFHCEHLPAVAPDPGAGLDLTAAIHRRNPILWGSGRLHGETGAHDLLAVGKNGIAQRGEAGLRPQDFRAVPEGEDAWPEQVLGRARVLL